MVVGIGASAGGLEALELFLKHMPPESGLAFVIVQHLDPSHSSALAELLQRCTTMPVIEITDRMAIAPDHVYLIPPGTDLSVLHGVLHLFKPAAPRGLRLPIDFFFRSLADDSQHRSIGVILSGMGSDGAHGVRAIKERTGTVFVQSPESAKFDSMPRSAIATGMVDVIASPQELPGRILDFIQGRPTLAAESPQATGDALSGLEKVIILLRVQLGQDFSQYKKNTLLRRIERRMGLHQISAIEDYVRYLRDNSLEVEILVKEFLIGVTSFFRDHDIWEQLKSKVLPGMIAACPQSGVLRAWIPACSTGEEAYSLAIIFKECLEQIQPPRDTRLQIFATDLNADAIAVARTGTFSADIASDVSKERLHRFFTSTGESGYQVRKEIRDMVIFAPQNVITDPPFTKLDLLICRNLLIYLESELQERLMTLFRFSLKPGGVLMLGNSETVGMGSDLFTGIAGQLRLYQRTSTERDVMRPDYLAYQGVMRRTEVGGRELGLRSIGVNLQHLAEQFLMKKFTPPSVLVNEGGDILYFSGKTDRYLAPPTGKANLNLFAMARDGINRALVRAFHRAVRDEASITIKAIKVREGGRVHKVDMTIQPFSKQDALRGMTMVIFAESGAPDESTAATIETEADGDQLQELSRSSEAMMILRDEMQVMQEEFTATKEELQSTIEELQSTNEELSTSKEEMQSTNEELQSVNSELRTRLDDLSRASSDMSNLINSTEIAVLFLDDALKVRRFSSQATNVFKLIPGDVGRPLLDLASDLDYADLAADVREVMHSLIPRERQVTASGARWFSVRILPYRTQENRIDGVVIILLDITQSKALEAELRATQDALRAKLSEQAEELKEVQAERNTGVPAKS